MSYISEGEDSGKFFVDTKLHELQEVSSAGLMALIKGRSRQRVRAALRKAYDDETVNQCYSQDGSLNPMEAANLNCRLL